MTGRAGTLRIVAIVLGIAATISGVEFYALRQSRHFDAPQPVAQQKALVEGPIGAVDTPAADAVMGPRVHVSGWALDPAGIARVEIRLDDRRFDADIGIARPDVAQIKAGLPQSERAGFNFVGD